MNDAMKIRIDAGEVYPVYSFVSEDSYGLDISVPAKTVRRWRRAQKAYDRMQREMRDALTAHYGHDGA